MKTQSKKTLATVTSPATREQWLASVTAALRGHFTAAGFTVPDNVRSTCGFPSKSALGRRSRRIGECWDSRVSEGQMFEIFISPLLSDSVSVAATLAHELVHATVGLAAGHGPAFRRCAEAIGLTGKMTATKAGPAFEAWFAKQTVGPYPHQRLNASNAGKKQSTRMLKCVCEQCAEEGAPYIVRLSASALAIGAPICPVHGEQMTPA